MGLVARMVAEVELARAAQVSVLAALASVAQVSVLVELESAALASGLLELGKEVRVLELP